MEADGVLLGDSGQEPHPNFKTMTLQAALQAIGIDPVAAANGVTFPKTGRFYQVAAFIGEQRGVKLFRVLRDGKPVMVAQEQMCAIFA